MMNFMHITIVHNEEKISSCVEEKIKDIKHYSFSNIHEEEIISEIQSSKIDAVVFDSIKQNNKEGNLLLVRKIRSKCGGVPIVLIVSSNEDICYIQNLLDEGVDTCIKGDFLKEELILRLNKLIEKKNNLLFTGTSIKMKDTVIDIKNHSVYFCNNEIYLTKTEYNILFHLFMHKNSLVKNEELNLCLRNSSSIKSTYLLNIHIHNLRKKLSGADWIKTINNYGFMVLG